MVTAGNARRRVGIGMDMEWSLRQALDFPRCIGLWAERRCLRRALARMDEHLLRDIGLTLGEAADEAAKPFWRA